MKKIFKAAGRHRRADRRFPSSPSADITFYEHDNFFGATVHRPRPRRQLRAHRLQRPCLVHRRHRHAVGGLRRRGLPRHLRRAAAGQLPVAERDEPERPRVVGARSAARPAVSAGAVRPAAAAGPDHVLSPRQLPGPLVQHADRRARLPPVRLQRPRVVGRRRRRPLGGLRQRRLQRPLHRAAPGQLPEPRRDGHERQHLVGAPGAARHARGRRPMGAAAAGARVRPAPAAAGTVVPGQRGLVARRLRQAAAALLGRAGSRAGQSPEQPGRRCRDRRHPGRHRRPPGRARQRRRRSSARSAARPSAQRDRRQRGGQPGRERAALRAPTQVSGPPLYWDTTYMFRGTEHHVQTTAPAGPTLVVNGYGEPRMQ